MNIQMISSLFVLFSGETDSRRYLPLITAAVYEVMQQLRPEADGSEARLCYLAAAVANLRYVQMFGARETALATYAGNVTRNSDFSHIRFAKQLVLSYRRLCTDLLKEEDFVFTGIRG